MRFCEDTDLDAELLDSLQDVGAALRAEWAALKFEIALRRAANEAHIIFPHIPTGIVPGDIKLNATAWRVAENRIAAETKKGFAVRGSITMDVDSGGRPKRFVVSYEVLGSEREPVNIEIPNEAPK